MRSNCLHLDLCFNLKIIIYNLIGWFGFRGNVRLTSTLEKIVHKEICNFML